MAGEGTEWEMRMTFRCPHFTNRGGLPDGPKLVGFGFRCWVMGFSLQDPTYWGRAWNVYRGVFKPDVAEMNFRALEAWARAINVNANRPLSCHGHSCPKHSADERLAISLVAAAQEGACPALKACAFALLDNGQVEPVVQRSFEFGLQLAATGVPLDPCHIDHAALDYDTAIASCLH